MLISMTLQIPYIIQLTTDRQTRIVCFFIKLCNFRILSTSDLCSSLEVVACRPQVSNTLFTDVLHALELFETDLIHVEFVIALFVS